MLLCDARSITGVYHTFNSRECMGVNGKALQLHAVHIFYYKSRENPYQYYKSCENLYQVLQVTCTSRAMKSKVHYTSLYKKYHSFVAIGIVTRAVHS